VRRSISGWRVHRASTATIGEQSPSRQQTAHTASKLPHLRYLAAHIHILVAPGYGLVTSTIHPRLQPATFDLVLSPSLNEAIRHAATQPALSILPEDIWLGTSSSQETSWELRVDRRVPEAAEKAYPHWHGIGYSHPAVGYFCAIFPHDEFVKLGFEFGVLLADPRGLLEGEGKQVRYVTIHNRRQIHSRALKNLLLAAVSLPEKREVRLSMIQGIQQAAFEK
jgi:hypothetical protein